jgi:hypothetical protein
MNNAVVCLTSKNIETMISDGGVGFWKAQTIRLEKYQYIIAILNKRSNWSYGEEAHRTPFLIGEIDSIKVCGDRKLIKLKRYAKVQGCSPIKWAGASPIYYMKDIITAQEGTININNLLWKDWPSKIDENTIKEDKKICTQTLEEKAITMISQHYGVLSEQVKISIEN